MSLFTRDGEDTGWSVSFLCKRDMASNGGLIEQFCSVNRSDRLGEPLSVLRPPADSDKELCSVRIDGIIRGALRSSICAAGRTRRQSLVEAEIHIARDFRSRGQPTGAKRRNALSCPDDSVICRHADLVGDTLPEVGNVCVAAVGIPSPGMPAHNGLVWPCISSQTRLLLRPPFVRDHPEQ